MVQRPIIYFCSQPYLVVMTSLLRAGISNLRAGTLNRIHPKCNTLRRACDGSGRIVPICQFSRPLSLTAVKPNTDRQRRTASRLNLLSCGITITSGLALYLWFSSPVYSLDAIELPSAEKMDPATSIKFPTVLKLEGEPEMKLLGVGVRTVSFLSIRVYSVGFYADLANMDLEYLGMCKSAEERIETLLKTTSCALRIVPTRATSYSHLRDGFVRTIQGRQTLARKAGSLEAEQEEALHVPLQKFKGLFPTAAFKKQQPMHVVLSSPKIQPRQLRIPPMGTVNDTWIAIEFFRAYFQGSISPPLIEDVKHGVDNITLGARP